MKKYKISFWLTTAIIFVLGGVMSALTSHTEPAKEALQHLGYPEYFGPMLMVFKVLGSLALIIPQVPGRVKEWAYAGFGIDFIAAFVSIWAVDGFTVTTFFPIVMLGVLIISNVSYHKLSSK